MPRPPRSCSPSTASPGGLSLLTPPWEKMEVVEESIRPGSRVVLKTKFGLCPSDGWPSTPSTSRVRLFADRQVSGHLRVVAPTPLPRRLGRLPHARRGGLRAPSACSAHARGRPAPEEDAVPCSTSATRSSAGSSKRANSPAIVRRPRGNEPNFGTRREPSRPLERPIRAPGKGATGPATPENPAESARTRPEFKEFPSGSPRR